MTLHSADNDSRPRRSAWRFRLLSLFILIAIVAVCIRGFQIWSARVRTAAALAETTSVDVLNAPLADIVDLIGKRNDLRIQMDVPDANRLVTSSAKGTLGEVLDALLSQHDCEYSVTLDGVIVITGKSPE